MERGVDAGRDAALYKCVERSSHGMFLNQVVAVGAGYHIAESDDHTAGPATCKIRGFCRGFAQQARFLFESKSSNRMRERNLASVAYVREVSMRPGCSGGPMLDENDVVFAVYSAAGRPSLACMKCRLTAVGAPFNQQVVTTLQHQFTP
jgi:hypothetical protein